MRRSVAILLLVITAGLLAGCVYDPYTGAYYPCCSYYGYPYRSPYPYRYPYPNAPYYQYQGYPNQPGPQTQPPPPPGHP